MAAESSTVVLITQAAFAALPGILIAGASAYKIIRLVNTKVPEVVEASAEKVVQRLAESDKTVVKKIEESDAKTVAAVANSAKGTHDKLDIAAEKRGAVEKKVDDANAVVLEQIRINDRITRHNEAQQLQIEEFRKALGFTNEEVKKLKAEIEKLHKPPADPQKT